MFARIFFVRHGNIVSPLYNNTRCLSSLVRPTVLFQDNHILVVNKTPGWHSVPNPGPHSPKCLLSELKHMKLGGGSTKDFLLSVHRLDQPCSGILLFAKTKKAASRLNSLWKKKMVEKEYLCVVSKDNVERLIDASQETSGDWYSLEGRIAASVKNNRSVRVYPVNSRSQRETSREISIEWRFLETNEINPEYQIVLVKTRHGARHMVRAILAQQGKCPVVGDIRYNSSAVPLNDKSIALHAYRLSLNPSLQLGSLSTFQFEAPLPKTWGRYFGIRLGDLLECTRVKG